MRISLTLKFVVGVLITLTLSLVVLLWKSSELFVKDKVLTLKEQAAQLSYTTSTSVSEKLRRIEKEVFLLSEVGVQGTDEIALVGELRRQPSSPWTIQWFTPVSGMQGLEKVSSDFLLSIQRKVVLEQIGEHESFISKIQAGDQAYFVFIKKNLKAGKGEEKFAVGILRPIAFMNAVGASKGAAFSSYVIDSTGMVVAHSSIQMLGADLTQNPVVNEIIAGQDSSHVGEYKENEGTALIASYDQVADSNLYAVSSVSWAKASIVLSELRYSFLILGGALFLLAGLLMAWMAQAVRRPLLDLKSAVLDLANGRTPNVQSDFTDEISDLADSVMELDQRLKEKEQVAQVETSEKIYKEKMRAFSQLSAGLVNELRNPMIGILGHAQLAKEKMRDPEAVRRHLDLIERDTRKTKELIEDISNFTGVDKLELSTVNMFEAVSAALEQASRRIHSENITIVKNLESVSNIVANSSLLRKFIINILNTAAQLYQKSADRKEMIVRLESEDKQILLSVIFKSDLISLEDLKSIFEPFKVTQGDVNLGLDLALAKGIAEAHDGTVSLQHLAADTYQFQIRIPRAIEIPRLSPIYDSKPGVELKGLNFGLPEYSMSEAKVVEEATLSAPQPMKKAETTSMSGVVNRRLLSKVPFERLKIKVKQPKLRL